LRIICPICKGARTAPVLFDREIYVTGREGVRKRVGADLSAFRCETGHVFFVLTDDLPIEAKEERERLG
jgi:hypothetical protein